MFDPSTADIDWLYEDCRDELDARERQSMEEAEARAESEDESG